MIGIDFVIISGFTKGFGQATPQVYAKDGTVPEANWRRMDDMPVSEGITHAAFFVLGSKFYMCGGYLGGHPGLHIPTCLIYDHSVAPGSGQWDRSDSFPDLPEGRAGGGMVYDSVTNVAVFAGGAIRPTAGNAHAEDRRDAWKIDLGNMSAGWQRVTEIPFKSNHMSFVTAKDGTGAEHHFFVGGQVGENEITGNVDDNYEYNVAADTWIQHPNMPFTRGHAASSTRAYGNGYIVVAGSTNEYGKTSDISYYDIPSQSWTKNIGKLPNALNTPVCAISPVNMNGVQFYHCESGKPTEKFSYFREISL
jgi:N-acetylneuraminic acid mutarotase